MFEEIFRLHPDFRTSTALAAVEDALGKLDLPAVESLIARNEAEAKLLANEARDEAFFRHVLERQKLILFFAREWTERMKNVPPKPLALEQLKALFTERPLI